MLPGNGSVSGVEVYKKIEKHSSKDEYPEVSAEVWRDNYKYKDEQTLQDTWERQARACAAIEDESIRQQVYEDFLWLLTDFKGIAGGRITANLGVPGRKATTLFNCFVHAPSDINYHDPDSINGIYDMLKAQAHTLKSEGGYGMNFSWIRPGGAYVEGIDGRTPGVLKFMELWDKSSEIITMGSEKTFGERKPNEKRKMRKGAQMGILSVWHPEIEDFIDAKLVEGRLTKFNISVGITDGFMHAVNKDLSWNLKFPDTYHKDYEKKWKGDINAWEKEGLPVVIYKTVSARYLWEKIMRSTYTRNDPGILFLDLANKLNPLSYAENIQTCNPCQPGWATVLTPNGISMFDNISVGDTIWSGTQWTQVIKKVCTGVKPIYAFRTTAGTFYGTENHRIVSDGKKIEVKDAESIDINYLCESVNITTKLTDEMLLAIMDGLVIGDGMMHKAYNNLVTLLIGNKDQDYFDDDISQMILEHRPGITEEAWIVKTSIKHLPKTYDRKIPDKYKFGNFDIRRMFLRGLYAANGSVAGNRINLKAVSFQIVEDVQMMLSSLGIPSYYTTNKAHDVEFSNGVYECKESYDVSIGTRQARIHFMDLIGFIQKHRYEKAVLACETNPSSKKPKTTFDIKEKEFLGEEKVYDITVDADEHTYWSGGLLVSNCGEINMSTGVCLLFSFNLVKYLKKINDNYEFDFDKFKKAVVIGTRFADNINDISNTPLKEYDISLQQKRRIGLGVLGLGSLHYVLGIRFGSPESLDLIERIFKTKAETEILTSAKLGKEKGSFELFDRHEYFNTYWWKAVPISDEIKNEIEEIGEMRNSHHSANAPTGNMSIYAGLVSGGIEPVFLKEYVRWIIVPEVERASLRKQGFSFPDIFSGEWFETENLKESKAGTDPVLLGSFNGVDYQVDKNRGLTKKAVVKDWGWDFIQKNFSREKVDDLIKNDVLVTTNDLSVNDHVNTLKVIAKYVNMNSSKTVNLSNDYSYDNFKDLYLNAYNSGIKGITSYRAGTMTSVLEDVKKRKEELPSRDASPRPTKLSGETHKIKIDFGDGVPKNAYVTVSFFDDTRLPYEMFVQAPHFGLDEKDLQILELTARNTSMSLRHKVPIKYICEQLDKIGGQYLFSIPTNIARILRKYDEENKDELAQIKSEDVSKKEENGSHKGLGKCPRCRKRKYALSEGCGTCLNCGFSGC